MIPVVLLWYKLDCKETLHLSSLEESLQQLVTVEPLIETNQLTLPSGTKANGYRQTIFEVLPAVCCFQLKRFMYNSNTHSIQKVRYRVPVDI